jgi:O-antigen/teichoic acid export membrane protein
MGGAAIMGVLLNWALVPKFGAMGSAVANVLAYIVWVASSLVISERYWKVSFNVGTMTLQFLIIENTCFQVE